MFSIYQPVGICLQKVRAEHGRDAVGLYMGNPNVHNLDAQVYLSAVARAVQSRNRFSATTIDQLPKQLVAAYLYGHPMSVPVPDIDRSMFVLVLGANPLVSNGSMMTAPNMRDRVRALQARGGKVIVVDPVKTRTAKAADEHHRGSGRCTLTGNRRKRCQGTGRGAPSSRHPRR